MVAVVRTSREVVAESLAVDAHPLVELLCLVVGSQGADASSRVARRIAVVSAAKPHAPEGHRQR